MQASGVTRDVLASPTARAAVLRGDRGTLIRLAREALGLRQSDLGDRLGYSQSTISRVEGGGHHANDMGMLQAAARMLGIPPAMLGLAGAAMGGADQGVGELGGTTMPWPTRRDDDVRRLEFLGLMAGSVAGPVAGSLFPEETEPRKLGGRDVTRLRHDLRRLYELDDHHGGADVYALAVRSMRTLRRTAERARYKSSTGRALWSMLGELTEHAGWLAYDAGRHDEARRWWLEALHTARLADDGRVETVVMASMSLQASRCGSGSEAVQLAQAAGKSAEAWVTPRLRSLLLAREALGHSRAGDAKAARKALRQASSQLDRGRADNDPLWLDFYGEADYSWHEAGTFLDLAEPTEAEQAIRRSLTAVGTEYPRNRALYLSQLADLLVSRRRLDEGVRLASHAVSAASDLGSSRVDRTVDGVRRRLTPYARLPEVHEFLEWSGQVLAGRVGAVPVA